MQPANGQPARGASASGGGNHPPAGGDWLQGYLFGDSPEPPGRPEPAPGPPAASRGPLRDGKGLPAHGQPPSSGRPSAAGASRRNAPASQQDKPVVWEVDRRVLPAYVRDLPGNPHLVICVDRATGFILAADMVPADAPATVVTETVAKLACTGVPDAIAVMSPLLAQVLRIGLARLGLAELPVTVARSLPAVTKALRSLGEFMGADFEAPRRYWRDLARAYPDLPGLVADAAAYFQAAPWRTLTDEDVVTAQLVGGHCAGGGRARTRYLCVLGAAGETFGLAVFTTRAGYRALAHHEGHRLPTVSLMSVTFDDGSELDEESRARLARRYGIPDPAAFPFFMRQEGGGKRRIPAPEELDELRVWLQVVPAFVERHRQELARRSRRRSRPASPLCDRFAITVGPARFEAEVEFPAAD